MAGGKVLNVTPELVSRDNLKGNFPDPLRGASRVQGGGKEGPRHVLKKRCRRRHRKYAVDWLPRLRVAVACVWNSFCCGSCVLCDAFCCGSHFLLWFSLMCDVLFSIMVPPFAWASPCCGSFVPVTLRLFLHYLSLSFLCVYSVVPPECDC